MKWPIGRRRSAGFVAVSDGKTATLTDGQSTDVVRLGKDRSVDCAYIMQDRDRS